MSISSVPPVAEAPPRLGFWRIRYTMFFPFYYCYVFMQLDKILVSLLMPVISGDLGFTTKQVGNIFMVFGFAYAVSALFGGLASSKYGPKRIIALSLSAYSLALWWTGAVTNYISFLWRYLIFGLAEGMEPSAAAQLLMRWFPRGERAKITAIWYTNVTLAPAILPFIALPVFNAVGWRWTFGLAAMCGLLGLFLCKILIFDRPEDFNWRGKTISKAELEEIYQEEILEAQKGGKQDVSYKEAISKPVSVLEPLKNLNIWLLAIGQFLYFSVLWGVNFWLPMFFTKQLGLTMATMGGSMAFYYFMGFVGQMTGGAIADYWGHRKWVVVISATISGAVLILLSQFATIVSVPILYIMIGLLSFCIQSCITAMPPLQAEIVGPELAGSAYGITNFFGQIGTATTGFITGLLVYTVAGVQKYDHAMIYWACCALAAAVIYSIVKEQVRLKKGKLVVE